MVLLAALALQKLIAYDPIALIERYRAYRLPEPPLTAKPVVCVDESTVQVIEFQVPGKRSNPIYEAWRPIGEPGDEVKVSDAQTTALRKIYADGTTWPTVALLEMRGYHDIARRLLYMAAPDLKDPLAGLHNSAWGYWRQWAIEHPQERQKTYEWLRAMPSLDGFKLNAREKSFLMDLQATLHPAAPIPNPSRYDDLLEQTLSASGSTSSDLKYGIYGDDGRTLATPVLKLLQSGYSAIPAMERHLGDRRLTRLGLPGDSNPFYHRVCDVAADVIEACLDGESDYYAVEARDMALDERPDVSNDGRIAKLQQRFLRAWNKAKAEGEDWHYMQQLKFLDEPEKGALDTVTTDGVRAYPLLVLAAKYRGVLARFCRRVRYAEERSQIEGALRWNKSPPSFGGL